MEAPLDCSWWPRDRLYSRRWHLLGGVEKTGIDLELLPMLLGFFTYKAGVVSKQFVDLVGAAARGTQEKSSVKGETHHQRLKLVSL